MNLSILALRAISAVTFQRVFKGIIWVVAIVFVLLVILTIYLGGWINPWWFLLFVILTPLIILCVALAAALQYLSNRLLPRPLTKEERQTIQGVTDRILRIAEVRATPWPILAFQIGKDVLRGRPSKYIESIIDDTTGLRKSFNEIRQMFEKKELK
jgi:hypothetical protein